MRILMGVVTASSALAACLVANVLGAHAQSIGATYGARDPHICSDRSDPKSGSISPDIAARYVLCATEGVSSDLLYLSNDVVVQIGKGRPFLRDSDGGHNDINTEQLLYPIRGSYQQYQCDKWKDAGSNCTIYNHPNAEGVCYKTVFADWRCHMADRAATVLRTGAPPPS